MARKLWYGYMTLGACVLLAGCQNSAGSRLAGRGPVQPIMAKQNQAPPPSFPQVGANGQNNIQTFNTSQPGGSSKTFPMAGNVAPAGAAFPTVNQQNAPHSLAAPPGPTNVNRPDNNVITTTPPQNLPQLPPNLPPSGATGLAPTGISPIMP